MKSLKILSLVMMLALALTGCKDNKDDGGNNGPSISGFDAIENEWKLVSVNGVPNDFHVYISFDSGTFFLFQQVYTLDFLYYDGTYSVANDKLSGTYKDGTAWKCDYSGGVSKDGKTLTLKSEEQNPVTFVYEACVIPEDVKEEATATRAIDVVPFL